MARKHRQTVDPALRDAYRTVQQMALRGH